MYIFIFNSRKPEKLGKSIVILMSIIRVSHTPDINFLPRVSIPINSAKNPSVFWEIWCLIFNLNFM